MQERSEALETIEISGLEYDVAAAGAEESSDSTTNHAAYFLVSYRQPESLR